jgi:type II secretory pathway predicted ATPase ExeA
MYNQFFALRENPFNVNPDPRYLFLTRQTREALDGLMHGIQNRKGLLLLTGEVGTGKTTLLNHLLGSLHQQQTPTAFIFNSHLEVSHLFDFVLADFGVKFDSRVPDNALMRLQQWLLERYRAGETPVVIVDEAQGLPNRVLEEIRMLLNLETSNEKLLQIVLAGQPELEERLQQPHLRQVKQRLALRCKTAALSLEETHQYVKARLHIAGADSPLIFASDAVDAVHFYSRGIPRVMNLLCEHALLNASFAQIRPVPARFVAAVASEFQFDDIRPVAPSLVFGEDARASGSVVESRFMNALVSLTKPSEPLLRECPDPSPSAAAGWSATPNNVFSAVTEPATPILNCAIPTGNSAAAAIAVPSSTQLTAPAAPWLKQLEARLLSDWTTFFSEVGSSLASEPPTEPAPSAQPPRLHLVEARANSDLSSVSSRSRIPSRPDFSRTPSRVGTTKLTSLSSSLMLRILALRLLLVRSSAQWRARLLSKVTSPAWTRMTAILLQPAEHWLRPIKSLFWQCLAWWDKCLTIVSSIDWAHLRMTTARWLRQPCDPTQWRLLDSRLFEEMFRFNQKKM